MSRTIVLDSNIWIAEGMLRRSAGKCALIPIDNNRARRSARGRPA